MTNRLSIILGLLVLAGCSDQSSKATAEQAVAYMIFGLEEGALLAKIQDAPIFHQTSTAPLTYVAEKPPSKVSVTITRNDDCNYAVDFGLGKQNLQMSVDFSTLSSVTIVDQGKNMGTPEHGTTLNGARMTCVKGEPQCQALRNTTHWPFRFEDKDPSRLPGMVTYFQTNFCKGKPD
jgi:hypothetical protein